MPQSPVQGSVHFCLTQAWLLGHSLFTRHSGLQLGGEPTNSGIQAQEALLSGDTVHWEFGPHGEGLHGSWLGSSYCGSVR